MSQLRSISMKLVAIVIVILVVGAVVAYHIWRQSISQQTVPVKIVWVSTQFGPPAEQAFVKDVLLAGFRNETGIDVEFIALDYGGFYARMESEQTSGKVTSSVVTDIFSGLDYLASKGWLEDLSKFGTLPGRTFLSKSLEKYSYLYGNLYGIKAFVPSMISAYIMVVNKEAFKYLPEGLTEEDVLKGTSKWTYDALLAWAKKLNDATGSPKLGFPLGPKGLFFRFLHGHIYPAFTGAQVKNFNSDEAVAMWTYLRELWRYVHPGSTTWDSMADPLLRGDVWIAWDHSARIKDAIMTKPDQFVAVPVPSGPKGRGYLLVLSGLAIPKNAPHQDAAWKLIEYLTRPETQLKILENVGFYPAVQEASARIPAGPLKILVDGIGNQLSAPDSLVALIPSLGAKAGDFQNIYLTAFQRIVLNNEDIRTVLNELAPELMNLFKEVGAPLPPPDSGT